MSLFFGTVETNLIFFILFLNALYNNLMKKNETYIER
jgi:hypothetical protein